MAVGDLPGVNKDELCRSCQDTYLCVSITKPTPAKASECYVQIVELLSVGIWTSYLDRDLLSIYFSWFFFDDLRDDLRVLL